VPRKHEPVAFHYNRATNDGYTGIARISPNFYMTQVRRVGSRLNRVISGQLAEKDIARRSRERRPAADIGHGIDRRRFDR
jgi:hypothetical protein